MEWLRKAKLSRILCKFGLAELFYIKECLLLVQGLELPDALGA